MAVYDKWIRKIELCLASYSNHRLRRLAASNPLDSINPATIWPFPGGSVSPAVTAHFEKRRKTGSNEIHTGR